MRVLLILALLLSGCSRPGQGVAYVVNRTGSAAGQGKSYNFPAAVLTYQDGALSLQSGEDVQLVVNVTQPPPDLLGQKLSLAGGMVNQVPVTGGYLILQTLREGTYGGNFNAVLPNGLEAVGNFEARL